MSIAGNVTHVELGHAVTHNKADNNQQDLTANVASIGASGSDNICGDGNTNQGAETPSPVASIRALVGRDAVLLPITIGQKGPRFAGWQNTTIQEMDDPAYLRELETGNIGVLLGEASGGLCAIDIDDDALVEPFLEQNPESVSYTHLTLPTILRV